jgi:hypothetical protein
MPELILQRCLSEIAENLQDIILVQIYYQMDPAAATGTLLMDFAAEN